MLDSRSYVLEKCPSAESVWREPFFEIGRISPKRNGYWEIQSRNVAIGVGATEQLAWDDAARNILNNE